MSQAKILCLMGPTAAGKTDAAVALVEQLNGEIISVDSAMVYRGLNIGSAKPDAAVLARAPHHLLDIRDPWVPYSAADFFEDATRLIADIQARGKLPLLVGGTMLYFKALLNGLADLPPADPKIRTHLQATLAAEGLATLYRRLQQCDAAEAARLHPHDTQRILRALEVFLLTGETMTTHWARAQQTNPWRNAAILVALAPQDRAILHARIAVRFDQMLAQGLLDEVARLRQCPKLDATLPAIRSVGYRQVWRYLAGEDDFACMRERAIIATRQLAKRQLTWLRAWEGMHWIDSEAPDVRRQLVEMIQAHP